MSTIVSIGYEGISFTAYIVSGKVVGAYQGDARVSNKELMERLQEVYNESSK